jgi:hypothetical protein
VSAVLCVVALWKDTPMVSLLAQSHSNRKRSDMPDLSTKAGPSTALRATGVGWCVEGDLNT